MKGRLAILAEHGLTMSTISDVIAGLEPLEGAKAFLDELRSRTQVIILSDTFEQFAAPLMRHLGMPTILCHQLVVGQRSKPRALIGGPAREARPRSYGCERT
jgi:phosphoserine/homoserine phosphotransferase